MLTLLFLSLAIFYTHIRAHSLGDRYFVNHIGKAGGFHDRLSVLQILFIVLAIRTTSFIFIECHMFAEKELLIIRRVEVVHAFFDFIRWNDRIVIH